MKRFVKIVNGWKPLTPITKRSILDVPAALDPSLIIYLNGDGKLFCASDSRKKRNYGRCLWAKKQKRSFNFIGAGGMAIHDYLKMRDARKIFGP